MRAACSCVAWLAFPLLAAGGIAGEPVRVSLWTVEVPVEFGGEPGGSRHE